MTWIEGDLAACAGVVERGDPDRFAAAMAAPVGARARLFPLYAFNLEVARAPWVASEPMIAEMRLQWWRDVLEEIAVGGPVRRHEVATPLSQVLPASAARDLDAMIEARRWDIYRAPFADTPALQGYLADTGGRMMQAAGAVLVKGALSDPVSEALHGYGTATAVAVYLRAVPDLEARGRVPLVDGRAGGVAALAGWGQGLLQAARRVSLPDDLRPALLSAWQTGALLRMAQTQPGRVAEGALRLSEAARRGRLLWSGVTGRV